MIPEIPQKHWKRGDRVTLNNEVFVIDEVVLVQMSSNPVTYDIRFYDAEGSHVSSIKGLCLASAAGKEPKCGCGKPMVKRFSRATGAPFWGCSGFPDCKCTMPCRDGTPNQAPRPMTEQERLGREFDEMERQKQRAKFNVLRLDAQIRREVETGTEDDLPF